jgi:hypothetical protein
MTYGIGNQDPGLGQAQKSGRLNLLFLKNYMFLYNKEIYLIGLIWILRKSFPHFHFVNG